MVEMFGCMVCDSPITRERTRGRKPAYCSASCRGKAKRILDAEAGRGYRRKGQPTPDTRARVATEAALARWAKVPPEERAEHARGLARFRWGEGYVPQPSNWKPRQPRKCRFCGETVPMTSRQQSCGKDDCRLARNAERMRQGAWMKARRAAETTTMVEQFTRESVYERDGWVCGICGGLVDKTLRHPDKMSASLDHIIPLSHGGTHTLGNVQCSHLTCNVAKGNRTRRRKVAA